MSGVSVSAEIRELSAARGVDANYAYWHDMPEERLAHLYMTGEMEGEDPRCNRWWIRHWEWNGSPYWDKLCRAHEAICRMVWEENPPELSERDAGTFALVAALNSHARAAAGYETMWRDKTVRKQIYWLKREAISDAMKRGLVLLRSVYSMLPCRACHGTGVYMWDHGVKGCGQGDRCRRCGTKGVVRLSFHECNVAERYVFHLPNDYRSPFSSAQIDYLRPWQADGWAPNRPGVRLPESLVSEILATLKERYWNPQPSYVREIYTYMNEVL